MKTYVDRPEAGTVAGGHVGVEGLDGIRPRHLTVLLVHVVGTGPRVVTEPDAEVLDLQGVLLLDLYSKGIRNCPFTTIPSSFLGREREWSLVPP